MGIAPRQRHAEAGQAHRSSFLHFLMRLWSTQTGHEDKISKADLAARAAPPLPPSLVPSEGVGTPRVHARLPPPAVHGRRPHHPLSLFLRVSSRPKREERGESDSGCRGQMNCIHTHTHMRAHAETGQAHARVHCVALVVVDFSTTRASRGAESKWAPPQRSPGRTRCPAGRPSCGPRRCRCAPPPPGAPPAWRCQRETSCC